MKQEVSIQQVLEYYELTAGLRVQKQGAELVGLCPFHEESRGSFHVSTSKNAFQCFGCKRKGNILNFVRYMEGLEQNQIRQAALLVAGWFNISPETPPEAPERADVGQAEVKVPEGEINAPLTFELKNLDAKHPYLKQRGLAPKTIKEFGLAPCQAGGGQE